MNPRDEAVIHVTPISEDRARYRIRREYADIADRLWVARCDACVGRDGTGRTIAMCVASRDIAWVLARRHSLTSCHRQAMRLAAVRARIARLRR